MKIIRSVKKIRTKSPAAVTVGIFDGVHRGHRKILRELIKCARRIKGKSCVVTFEPHPIKVLKPRGALPMLASSEHKMRLLEEEGVDVTAIIKFTPDFASMTPMRFAEDILRKRLNTKILLIGEDFVLGKGRSGNAESLKKIGRRLGFSLRIIKPLRSGSSVISSTMIRGLIMSGAIKKAGRLLGREVSVLGTVVKGSRRGRVIGFPTANVDPHHEAIPPRGVYIVKARIDGRVYRAILNIGFRPTFYAVNKKSEPVIEAHIFNFNKPIYGRDIEIIFLKRIRDEKKFTDKRKMAARVKKDIAAARKYFSKPR